MSSPLKTFMIGFTIVVAAEAFAGEEAPIVNLRNIEPLTIVVGGPGVMLTVTRQTAPTLTITNQVRVTYGADLVGFAEIRRVGEDSVGNSFILRFETAEQAAAAAKVLRLSDATPSPLRRTVGAKGEGIIQDAAQEPPPPETVRGASGNGKPTPELGASADGSGRQGVER